MWLIALAAGWSKGDLFTAPILANGHVTALPLALPSTGAGGGWYFGCLLISAVCTHRVVRVLAPVSLRPLCAGLMGGISLGVILGVKAVEGPIFFLDLAASIATAMDSDSEAGRLLSSNGPWAAACLIAAVWPVYRFWRGRNAPKHGEAVHGGEAVATLLGLALIMNPVSDSSASLFGFGHREFLFFPSEYAFLCIGIGAGLCSQQTGSRLGPYLVTLGLLWSTCVFFFPIVSIDSVSVPIETMAANLTSPKPESFFEAFVGFVFLCGLGAAWGSTLRVMQRRHWTQASRLVFLPIVSVILAHVLRPLFADSSGWDSVLQSWLNAALLYGALRWTTEFLVSVKSTETEQDIATVRNWDTWVVIGGFVLYAMLKSHAAGPTNTDENIYLYMAERLSHGEWPYRDYFFSHPPLHVVLPGLFFALFGFSISLAKLLTAAMGAVTLWTVWKIGRDHFGRWVGLVAFISLLFATEFLKATSNMTGVNMTVMWLVLGVFQAMRGNGGWAGVWFACAVCSGFYAIGPVCAVLVLLFFQSWRMAARQLLAFVLVAGAMNAGGYALGGDKYTDAVYRYHDLKPAKNGLMEPLWGAPPGYTSDSQQSVRLNLDGELQLVNTNDGSLLLTFQRPPGRVTSIAWTPDASRLLVGTVGGKVTCYNTRSGARVWTEGALGRQSLPVVHALSDGRRFVTGGSQGSLWLHDLETGHRLALLQGLRGTITAVDSTLSGSLITAGSSTGELGVWNTVSGVPFDKIAEVGSPPFARLPPSRTMKFAGALLSLDIAEGNERLLVAAQGSAASIHDLQSLERVATVGTPADGITVARFARGGTLYTGTRIGDITHHQAGGGVVSTGRVHTGAVRSIHLSDPAGVGISLGEDGDLRMWNLGHPEHSRSLAKEVRWAEEGNVTWRGFPAAIVNNVEAMLDSRPFKETVYYHPHLWLAFLLAPLLGGLFFLLGCNVRSHLWRFFDPRRFFGDSDGRISFVWLVALALVLEFSMFRELYSFYFLLILPFLALILGYVVGRPLGLLWSDLGTRPLRGLTVAIVAFGAIALWPLGMTSAPEIFPSEFARAGTVKKYDWRLAPVGAHFSDLTRDIFWRDERVTGEHARGVNHFLWSKKRLFRSHGEISSWIRERRRAGDTLAGASTSAPLIALGANIRLAGNESDTNSKRFKTGMLSPEEYWESICKDNVRFVLSSPRSYFARHTMRTLPVVRRFFRPVKAFYDPELRFGARFPFCIYERINPNEPCEWTQAGPVGRTSSGAFCPIE